MQAPSMVRSAGRSRRARSRSHFERTIHCHNPDGADRDPAPVRRAHLGGSVEVHEGGRFRPAGTDADHCAANSLLAQEASAATYNSDSDTLFVVGDGGTSVVQVTKKGKLINSMTLAPGTSPQGTDFYDTEGITYVGGGKFVLIEERDRQANLFTYVAGGTLHKNGREDGEARDDDREHRARRRDLRSRRRTTIFSSRKRIRSRFSRRTSISAQPPLPPAGNGDEVQRICSTRPWPTSRIFPISTRCRI